MRPNKPGGDSYAWESTEQGSWDQIEEDPITGCLKLYTKDEQILRKRRRDDGLRGVRRGIIRFCVLVIDMSENMALNDLKPTRANLAVATAVSFVREFFDQNPISQLSVVTTRDDVSTKMSPLSSDISVHVDALQKILRLGPKGNSSLQNTMDLTTEILKSVPVYGMREMLCIYGSLSTCDPGDVYASMDKLVSERIRASCVGLSAEIHIINQLTRKSNGTYHTALNEIHFDELFLMHVAPHPTTVKQTSASLIRMGFPVLKYTQEPKRFVNNTNISHKVGYSCPRCKSWIQNVPTECTLCGLILVSSPHLARSYHHLFPVPKFINSENANAVLKRSALSKLYTNNNNNNNPSSSIDTNMPDTELDVANCFGCLKSLTTQSGLILICPKCTQVFCIECDVFVHDSLHQCPGCTKCADGD